MDKSTFDSSLESFRQNFDLFSQKTRQSYRKCDLPGFLYWYSLWRIGNPLNGFIFPDDRYREEYTTAMELYGSSEGTTIKPDILQQIHSIAVKFMTDNQRHRDWTYRGFTCDDFISQITPAMEVANFVEKYLTITSTPTDTGKKSLYLEMMSKAIKRNDCIQFACWWSMWTIAKSDLPYHHTGNNDNGQGRKSMYSELEDYLDILDTRDSNGKYVYDVHCNPFAENWDIPSQPVRIALMNLKPFVKGQ